LNDIHYTNITQNKKARLGKPCLALFLITGLNLPLIELFAKDLIANVDNYDNVILFTAIDELLIA